MQEDTDARLREDGDFDTFRGFEPDEGTDDLCPDCGHLMELHRLEETALRWVDKHGVERPIRIRHCPEPIPVSDSNGED